jgi:hypothetical protein
VLTHSAAAITLGLMKRLALVLLAVVLLAPALVSASQLSQRRTLRESLAAVGCSGAASESESVGSQVVFTVSVAGCTSSSGIELTSSGALESISKVAWSASAVPFDAISATVYRSEDSSSATSRMFSSDELTARWGPRSPQLDWVLPDLIRDGWFAYLGLPAALLILALPIVLGVLAARRGVVVVFWRG